MFQCVEPFAVYRNGIPEVYGADRMVLAGDPILRTHRGHFVEAADRVEQATHRPGERRSVPIPPEAQTGVASVVVEQDPETEMEELSDAEQA